MNSSAWDKFRKQQAAEREQLVRLLSGIQELVDRCQFSTPSLIEVSALAATLHAFYTGLENIFKRLAAELDETPVRGDNWHRELLLRMKSAGPNRPALISPHLYEVLNDYMRFRHVFRNSYSFDLDWRKMAPLVLALAPTFRELESALDEFVK